MSSAAIAVMALLFGAVLGGMLAVFVCGRMAASLRLRLEAEHATAMARGDGGHRTELATANARLDGAQQRIEALDRELHNRETHLGELRAELSRRQTEFAERSARFESEKTALDEKLRLLADARTQLTTEFQNLAQRIFQEKVDRFASDSKTTLDLTLAPLRDQLTDFRRRVEEVYTTDTEGRVKLLHEIGSLQQLNRQMSDEALNLTRALKGDNKVQGGWGEVILERVLEESGLQKGREYETQVALRSEDGQRRLPDVIVRLPEGRDVIIDSKVSLVDYERYCSADNDEERGQALKRHLSSLQSHVDALSTKDYEGLEGVRTLDFVLVFVPIEAAFMKAMEADASLFSRAFNRNIIIVSPTTLLATLRTIQSIWRYERQSRNAEEIARRAGALHDQFALVLESLEEVGRNLQRTEKAYEQTLERFAKGRGNLVGRVSALQKLGAKGKKNLPESILALADIEDENPDDVPPVVSIKGTDPI